MASTASSEASEATNKQLRPVKESFNPPLTQEELEQCDHQARRDVELVSATIVSQWSIPNKC